MQLRCLNQGILIKGGSVIKRFSGFSQPDGISLRFRRMGSLCNRLNMCDKIE